MRHRAAPVWTVATLLATTLPALAGGGAGMFPEHPLWPREVVQNPEPPCEMVTPEGIDLGAWTPNLWPGGLVYYSFDPAVTQQNRDRTRIALDEISTFANITFIPRTNQPNYINVRNGTGNSSSVGQVGGPQNLTMVSWSSRYVICHEFFHALGQWHHHQRPDRNEYVVVNTANIDPARLNNYTIPSNAVAEGPYNFSSIMHYNRCSFVICSCPSACTGMDAAPGYEQFNSAMGNRSFMSDGDKATVISRYGAAIDDALEPNNTPQTALPLGTGATALKLLDFNDYFTIDVPQNGTVSAVFTGPLWSSSNAQVQLLALDGTVLAFANTALQGADYVATVSQPVPAGAVLVRVTRTQPWGGAYTLNITAPPPPNCPGDINSDGQRDTVDLTILIGNFAQTVPAGTGGDLNADGVVNTADLAALLGVFGTPCQ